MARLTLAAIIIGALWCVPAHAQHRGISLHQLIADCAIDARRNPIVLTCPAGCTVEIHNGATAAMPPQIVVSRACQALR